MVTILKIKSKVLWCWITTIFRNYIVVWFCLFQKNLANK